MSEPINVAKILEEVGKDFGAAAGPRPFDYAMFVERLKKLCVQGEKLGDTSRHSESVPFLQWKHEVSDLVARTVNSGYSVNTKVDHYDFDAYIHSRDRSPSTRLAAFERDMTLTLGEFRLIIANYERYGDPDTPVKLQTAPKDIEAKHAIPVPVAAAPVTPEVRIWPDKVTYVWLRDNVPLPVFGWVITAIAGAAALGFAVAAWEPIHTLLMRWAKGI